MIPELSTWQQVVDPLLHLWKLDVESRADDTALVQATIELDDNLAGTVVVDDLELGNVAMLLHDLEELDDHLGGGTDEDLALATLLGVVDALEGVVQHADADHDIVL